MISAFMHNAFRVLTCVLVLTLCCTVFAGEIHEAVYRNDISKVKALINDNADLVSSKDEKGLTPLHLAAANGYKDIAELLLVNKAEVNSKDNAGRKCAEGRAAV
jgi:ankyrin repeat protein